MLFKKDNYRYLDYVICRRRNERKKLLKIIILLIDFKIETHAKRKKKFAAYALFYGLSYRRKHMNCRYNHALPRYRIYTECRYAFGT